LQAHTYIHNNGRVARHLFVLVM